MKNFYLLSFWVLVSWSLVYSQFSVGSLQSTVDSRQLAVRSRQSTVDSRQLAVCGPQSLACSTSHHITPSPYHYIYSSTSPFAQRSIPAEAGFPPASPPPFPPRTMAEWEEVQALVVTWVNLYSNALMEIIRHGVEECTVIIIGYDETIIMDKLEDNDIPTENIQIIEADYNSVWVRDYGPWTVYQNEVDSLALVDWTYDDLSRIYDDAIPGIMAQALQLPHYEATEPPYDWIHAGGNTLRDGLGTFFSSNLVFETNPGKTEAQIDSIAQLYLGAERYFKLPVLPYDSIHHLDMHMCLLDEETILVGEYPAGVADGPQIEANLEMIEGFTTAFGNPYRIIRVPQPPNGEGLYPDEAEQYRTYTNSIFVNNTILVPTYEEQYDTTALRIYEEALPGYNVVGIDCEFLSKYYGAIHCITKLIGVSDPLLIAHARLRDQPPSESGFLVDAIIRHRSGIAEARLFYRKKGESDYGSTSMELYNEAEAIWRGLIPPYETGDVIEYYIEAVAGDGKVQRRPMPAPEGYFYFRLTEPDHTTAENTVLSSAALLPNPARTFTMLNMTLKRRCPVKLSLFNIEGQLVWSRESTYTAGRHEYRIPLENLPAGAYQLNIQAEQWQQSRNLMVIP